MTDETHEHLLHSIHDLVIRVEGIVSKMEVKAFYTIEEFSELTGLSPSTIRNYCNKGLLKATQVWTAKNGMSSKEISKVDGKRNGNWIVDISEYERLKLGAEKNLVEPKSNVGIRSLNKTIIEQIYNQEN